MSEKSEEHYKNNPNDIPHTPWQKRMVRKYHQLDHKFTISEIKNRVRIELQKEQIRADTRIKDMMIEMYPEEYAKALQEVFDRYGMMKGQKARRAEIVKNWGIKPAKMPKW